MTAFEQEARDGQEFTGALDAIARELITSGDVDQLLFQISAMATEALEWCDHAGVTVAMGGRITTPKLNDQIASLMDDLQVEYDEGPCLDAVRTGAPVTVVPDLEYETRWPVFAKEAWERTAIRSVVSERLAVSNRTLGALNLYSRKPHAFTAADQATVWLFTSYAALALYAAKNEHELRQALQTRDVIGQAKGILMARLGVDDDAAFDILRETSMNLNQRLREVASDVVEHEGDGSGAAHLAGLRHGYDPRGDGRGGRGSGASGERDDD